MLASSLFAAAGRPCARLVGNAVGKQLHRPSLVSTISQATPAMPPNNVLQMAARRVGLLHIRSNPLQSSIQARSSSAKLLTVAVSQQSKASGSRLLSTAASATGEERYAFGTRILHWIMAGGLIGCVGLVLVKQQVKDKQLQGRLMWWHKSFGLLMGAAIIPRVALRLVTKAPAAVPGAVWEQMAAKLTHFGLYGTMVVLPGTGIAMGYFGGAGLPFFFTKIDGADKDSKRPDIAKNAFKVHKTVGQVMEYMIPLHIGAAGFHIIKGQSILSRISLL